MSGIPSFPMGMPACGVQQQPVQQPLQQPLLPQPQLQPQLQPQPPLQPPVQPPLLPPMQPPFQPQLQPQVALLPCSSNGGDGSHPPAGASQPAMCRNSESVKTALPSIDTDSHLHAPSDDSPDTSSATTSPASKAKAWSGGRWRAKAMARSSSDGAEVQAEGRSSRGLGP